MPVHEPPSKRMKLDKPNSKISLWSLPDELFHPICSYLFFEDYNNLHQAYSISSSPYHTYLLGKALSSVGNALILDRYLGNLVHKIIPMNIDANLDHESVGKWLDRWRDPHMEHLQNATMIECFIAQLSKNYCFVWKSSVLHRFISELKYGRLSSPQQEDHPGKNHMYHATSTDSRECRLLSNIYEVPLTKLCKNDTVFSQIKWFYNLSRDNSSPSNMLKYSAAQHFISQIRLYHHSCKNLNTNNTENHKINIPYNKRELNSIGIALDNILKEFIHNTDIYENRHSGITYLGRYYATIPSPSEFKMVNGQGTVVLTPEFLNHYYLVIFNDSNIGRNSLKFTFRMKQNIKNLNLIVHIGAHDEAIEENHTDDDEDDVMDLIGLSGMNIMVVLRKLFPRRNLKVPINVTVTSTTSNVKHLSIFGDDTAKSLQSKNITSLDLSPLQHYGKIEQFRFGDFQSITDFDLSGLNNVRRFKSGRLPSVKRLDLSPLKNILNTEGMFLTNCESLMELDLSPLRNIRIIGSDFLGYCCGLRSIDLSPLQSITEVGSYFLENCTNLQSIDLTPLRNCGTIIRCSFLMNCSQLSRIDLSPLSHVTTIERSFLKGCSGLRQIDFTPLTNLTYIEVFSGFLQDCSSLLSVDLKLLTDRNIICRDGRVGENFLRGCSSLTRIDLTPLKNITTISDRFLSQCSSLKHIDLRPLKQIATGEIGSYFLSGCSHLLTFDTIPLHRVTVIDYGFLEGCTSLNSIGLHGLYSVKTIKGSFLKACTSLESLNLAPLVKVTSIGKHFLYNCKNLVRVNFSGLVGIIDIPNAFLKGCSNLKSADFSRSLHLVETIGDDFLSECVSLEKIDLRGLIKVKSIGNNFLKNCSSLATVAMYVMRSVTSTGDGFLMGTTSLKCVDGCTQENHPRNCFNNKENNPPPPTTTTTSIKNGATTAGIVVKRKQSLYSALTDAEMALLDNTNAFNFSL